MGEVSREAEKVLCLSVSLDPCVCVNLPAYTMPARTLGKCLQEAREKERDREHLYPTLVLLCLYSPGNMPVR